MERNGVPAGGSSAPLEERSIGFVENVEGSGKRKREASKGAGV